MGAPVSKLTALDAVVPAGPRTSRIVEDILDALPKGDRAAVQRALADYDLATKRFRVSSRLLAEALTANGHKIAQPTIARWRKNQGIA